MHMKYASILNTIARIFKQSKYLTADEWYRNYGIHTMKYYVAERWNHAVCCKVDGTEEYHVKWNKSKSRQIPDNLTQLRDTEAK